MSSESNQVENPKKRRPPSKLFAPIVIAGVTVGFLASAYKFVFAKPGKVKQNAPLNQTTQTKDEDGD